jgi:hypothetical protein
VRIESHLPSAEISQVIYNENERNTLRNQFMEEFDDSKTDASETSRINKRDCELLTCIDFCQCISFCPLCQPKD